MLRIIISCRALDWEQIEARLAILEEYCGSDFSAGLELMGHWDDFFSGSEKRKNIEINILKAKERCKRLYLSLHAPYKEGDFFQNFFSSDQGYENLEDIIEFARRMNISLVNIHASLLYSFSRLEEIKKSIDEDKQKKIDSVVFRIDQVLRETSFKGVICMENAKPVWSHVLDPRFAIYEIAFVDVEDLIKLNRLTAGRVCGTIDIAHFLSSHDSSELLSALDSLGGVVPHIHLNDGKGLWIPFCSDYQEDLVPGTGRMGETLLRKFLFWLKEQGRSRDINIVVEVGEEDYRNPVNSEESVRKITRILK
jgi:sugar phosphate isomerase/epimerase